MNPLDGLSIGLYLPGVSPLHRCDARLKLVAVPALVVATFTAGNIWQLFLLTGVALGAWVAGNLPLARGWRAGRALRWLLFFTLVVHTLLSPGRTLLGQSWLSADGQVTGLLTCWRLGLALIFAVVLSATTSPAGLAAALATLLHPLEKFRVPVRAGADSLLLVLHFIPVFREEALALRSQFPLPGATERAPSLLERSRRVRQLVVPLLLRLVERADRLAWQLAAGQRPAELGALAAPPPLRPAVLALFLGAALLLAAAFRSLE